MMRQASCLPVSATAVGACQLLVSVDLVILSGRWQIVVDVSEMVRSFVCGWHASLTKV